MHAFFRRYNGEVSVYSYVSFELEFGVGGYIHPNIPRVLNIRSAVYSEWWL